MHGSPPFLRDQSTDAVHASPTAGRSQARTAAIAGAAALFLSIAAPFGTASAGFATRLGYWVLLMAFGGACGSATAGLLRRRGWLLGPPWRAIAVLTLATTPAFTAVVWALTGWVFEGRLRLSALPGFVVPVLTVTAAVTSLNVLLRPRLLSPAAPATPHPHRRPAPEAPPAEPLATGAAGRGAPPPPGRVRFLDRLPPKLRGAELHAVEGEDHYLRLHTSRGSDLILCRLADAVAELEGLEGAQVHRSWWVARDAVREARRADGRAVLVLPDGTEAPVSRTYLRALREAGWL